MTARKMAAGAATESARLELRTQSRAESKLEAGRTLLLSELPSDNTPPARQHLQNLPEQDHQLGPEYSNALNSKGHFSLKPLHNKIHRREVC